MEHEEEKGKGFKVEDRRRFSAEGDLKPEYQSEQPAAASPPPATASSPAAAAEANPAVASSIDSSRTGEEGEINFTAFMVGLSTQALMHLGEIGDPQGGQPEIDLSAAQQLIDIVGMLKEKTRGNLDKDEEGLIDAILFELRMKYVERSRHA